jgi:peroxiredoxin
MTTRSRGGPHGPSRTPRTRTPLPAGTAAPPFDLRCAPHCASALDDFRGRRLVLAFYVADWHPVCGAQLALYQELLHEFERLGAALVGVSTDTLWSHAAFARALGLRFPLLADRTPHGAIARAYGVYDPAAGAARRGLFVVDDRGVVRWSAVFPDAINPGADGALTALERLAGCRSHTGASGRTT